MECYRLIKQYLPKGKIAQYIGGSYNQIMRVLAYWSMANSVVILVLGWDGSIGQFIRTILPWINFPLFLLFVVGLVILMIITDYFFIYPANVAFLNRQAVIHNNPIYNKLDKNEEILRRIAVKLGVDIKDLEK